MTNSLSIIPFLAQTIVLSALLCASTGCYMADDVYNPAPQDDGSTDADETDDAADDAGHGPSDDASNSDPADGFPADDEIDDASEPARCAFGEHVSDLADADHVSLGDFEHIFRPQDLADIELDQLQEGTDRFGWTDSDEIDALFFEIDDSRLLVRDLEVLTTGQSFTQIRFHVDGVEFGFLFATDSLRLGAGVDAGDIVACTVPLS